MRFNPRDQEAYERFERAVELPMLVLALLFVPILLGPLLLELSEQARAALELASWMIWGAFVAEYLGKLYLSPDRGHMVRTHVFDLVIIVLPFLRPLRALRVLRLAAVFGRATTAWRRLFARRGFTAFLGVALGIVVASGVLAWLLERAHGEAQITTPAEGVWWALVTSTTVGYGDMVPVSAAGRGVAVLLMLVGIALLSVVTAQIAAFFVEGDAQSQSDREAAELAERLDRIEQMLQRLVPDQALASGGEAVEQRPADHSS